MCIVTPGTRDANNGNWRTAARWATMLRERYRVIVQTRWDGSEADAMLALHARRSAESIREFRERGRGSLAVVLTGTDLYRDLGRSPEVPASLDAADRIIVLQEHALSLLPRPWKVKSTVVFQSARFLESRSKRRGRLDCVAVGHLRFEKDPETLFRAMASIPRETPIFVTHIGAALDERLGRAARELARQDKRYRYVGALPHGLARTAMARAHVLIHPSIMEGGANVIVEAVTSGTPVIASEVSGNVGMLGTDYPGYFPPGDASALASIMARALSDPPYLPALRKAAARRRPLFHPRKEKRALLDLVSSMLG